MTARRIEGLKAPQNPIGDGDFQFPLVIDRTEVIKAFRELPPIVKFFCSLLRKLAKKDYNEHGYTIYQRGNEIYIQEDKGSPALTVSDFSKLTGDKLLFVLKPDRVYLLHSHPFSSYPIPSALDIDTAARFRENYTDVVAIVVGRKYYVFY